MDQQAIGWDHFIRGRLTINWGWIVNDHLLQQKANLNKIKSDVGLNWFLSISVTCSPCGTHAMQRSMVIAQSQTSPNGNKYWLINSFLTRHYSACPMLRPRSNLNRPCHFCLILCKTYGSLFVLHKSNCAHQSYQTYPTLAERRWFWSLPIDPL